MDHYKHKKTSAEFSTIFSCLKSFPDSLHNIWAIFLLKQHRKSYINCFLLPLQFNLRLFKITKCSVPSYKSTWQIFTGVALLAWTHWEKIIFNYIKLGLRETASLELQKKNKLNTFMCRLNIKKLISLKIPSKRSHKN